MIMSIFAYTTLKVLSELQCILVCRGMLHFALRALNYVLTMLVNKSFQQQ